VKADFCIFANITSKNCTIITILVAFNTTSIFLISRYDVNQVSRCNYLWDTMNKITITDSWELRSSAIWCCVTGTVIPDVLENTVPLSLWVTSPNRMPLQDGGNTFLQNTRNHSPTFTSQNNLILIHNILSTCPKRWSYFQCRLNKWCQCGVNFSWYSFLLEAESTPGP